MKPIIVVTIKANKTVFWITRESLGLRFSVNVTRQFEFGFVTSWNVIMGVTRKAIGALAAAWEFL